VAYVRLDDSVMDNPKMLALSDRAFRGWVWGLCYAQRHLTDGFLPLQALTAAVKRAAGELQTRGLWGVVDRGFQIHDYLEYQDSKELVESRKASARDRMKDRRAGPRRAVDSTPFVRTNILGTSLEPPLHSISLSGSEKEKDRGVGERAATLLQDRYPEWYAQFRHGARLKLTANSLAYADAMKICETWDDARIEKLAQVFLTTDETWIASTDRSFRVFAARASWCDDRLTQAERAAV
jgi:hypothetical protein